MREIFFDKKLGETQRNSEGVQAARARMGCEPHGQGWGASRTGRDGSCGRDGSGEGSGSDENKKSEPFWGLTLYSNNEKRLNFF